MNFFALLLSSLATFRLSRLISEDKIFDWLRELVIRKSPKEIKAKARQGITCPFCISFYWSGAVTIYLSLWLNIIEQPLIPLWWAATWGGSVILNQIFVKLSK